MVFGRPIAKAIDHHVARHRMIAVQRVAATGEVVVITFRREHVVGLIVDAAKRNHRPAMIAFSRVVEHDIQNYFDTVPVQFLDGCLQLVDLHPEPAGRSIPGFRGKKCDGAVAPIIQAGALPFPG